MRARSSKKVVAATLVGLMLLSAACGGDDDDAEGTVAPPAATDAEDGEEGTTPQPGTEPLTDGSAEESAGDGEAETDAVLTVAFDLAGLGGGGPIQLDPTSAGTAESSVLDLIYGSLLHKTAAGTYEPELAESATIVDPSTIEITLRPGLTFTDGTPLDAEAVKFSMERNAASTNTRAIRDELRQVEAIDVTSPTELTVKLANPVAGSFYDLLAYQETAPVPVTAGPEGAMAEQPVGAGPFMLESFTPEQSLRLVKNPDYFDAESVQLAGVDYIQAAEGNPMVNALKAGTADAAPIASENVEAVEGGGIETTTMASDNSFLWFQVCKTAAPFDDVRVRQALNYAVDREAIAAAMTGGLGEPMQGFWTSQSKFFNPELADAYPYDVERAQELLAEAGQTGLSFDVFVIGQPAVTRFAEIVQQQWADAGIEAELVPSQNIVQDFFTDHKAPMAAIPLNRSGVDKVARNLVPGSIGNVCEYADPELIAVVDELRGVNPDSDEAVELWAQIQQLVFDDALQVFGIFTTQSYAWSDQLGGVEFVPDILGRIQLDVPNAYVKA